MKFQYKYYGATTVDTTASTQAFSFAPDTLRPPTYFDGLLRSESHAHLAFREALSALHAVVVDDKRPRGRDPAAYRTWLAANEQRLLDEYVQQGRDALPEYHAARHELNALAAKRHAALKGFWGATQKFFEWLYRVNRDAWIVLDPVITVHPERLLFEAFSQDESTYCAVSVSHNVFNRTGEMACGTTNIDYSASLFEEFQKIRSYKETRFQVDPTGFTVATGDDPAFVEEKIDLPDSWVRGFLQVSSAMTLPATMVELHPMDLHNICATLRQHKERAGPRSLRFELKPGQPATMVFEPWNITLKAPRSQVLGEPLTEARSVRIWGRRRLLTLERLIALATRVRVSLLGTGLPSFWIIDIHDITVTLGLSGWTANDWSAAGRFDLLQPRHAVSAESQQAVAEALQRDWLATPAALAQRTGLPAADVRAALSLWVQAGRAVYDLPTEQYAWRELAREPLPIEALRFASPEEAQAVALVHTGQVKVSGITTETTEQGQALRVVSGTVREGKKNGGKSKRAFEPVLRLNADEQLKDAQCSCNFFSQNKLRRGPCAHMLALRQLAQPQLNALRAPAAPVSGAATTTAGTS